MPVDPTDPETFEDAYDAYEEEPPGTESPEAAEADAAEQQADLLHQRDEPLISGGFREVDPADAAEQARVVELNEDEYR
ncbi:hypothetical protein ACH4LN_21730 [Streptomyces albus]|uniref:Uncharacterized protein n=1 Tax=Streptomyces albus TaxID=1888 RepID=A0A6C1C586_9ACTN|nr:MULTISPECIES: hypothetical protein [Streptomyces]KPC92479.1 hypothetical protein ADL27_24725 [Streptomyces sp. NRRL F-6602]EPD94927.1 hypothetical protein HMPREF1486_02741 [Streptomyces sp. HPH0547]MDI6409123.1 hypothetical protein [Streptomyces albus]QID38084.1 hypothetical protein G3260_004649 [Streptomyces albus]TGG75487.1 hypothetical protein D8771_31145 [Streptomyces albus]